MFTIQDFSFTPDNVTINANGIVKWTNNGATHTVTSGTPHRLRTASSIQAI